MVAPVPSSIEDSEDRMIIHLDPGGPIDLEGLGTSFAALARFYTRHHGPTKDQSDAPRLFISKLESGSIVAEIVPYVVMLGQAIPFVQQAAVVAGFTKKVAKAIRIFAGDDENPSEERPSKDDARDIREFVRPLTGRKGADLKIQHARFEKRDGERVTILEYKFDENELNRAALTIDAELAKPALPPPDVEEQPSVKTAHEAMLFFQQASRGAGKSSGRTADKAIIPAISDKPLPVYFLKDADLKEQMVQGQSNPLKDATFIVDADVQMVDGEPKGYLVSHVHKVIDSGE